MASEIKVDTISEKTSANGVTIDSVSLKDGKVATANSIDSDAYVDGSIDNAHIADDAIDSEHYAAGSIDTAHIADNQITLAKLAGGTDGNIISYDASGDPVAIATGSDGQVLTSTGAGSPPAFEAAPGGGLVHLQTQTVSSGVASVDFTSNIDSTYASYKLVVSDMRVDTDQAEVKIRYGAGSFLSANYGRTALAREASGSTTTGNSAASANGIYLTNQNAGNAADESMSFECILANPSNTDAHKIVYGLAGYIGADNDLTIHMFAGHYNSDTAAVTRIQVLPSSGNIDGGVFTLFGIAKT